MVWTVCRPPKPVQLIPGFWPPRARARSGISRTDSVLSQSSICVFSSRNSPFHSHAYLSIHELTSCRNTQ